MNEYGAISYVYDLLNKEIDYSAWADFIEKCFDLYLPKKPELLLDLACGTGSMTRELASRGYDMTGIDKSEDMLSVAADKSADMTDKKPIMYLCGDMRSFELYGTVGAVVCCLDSLNYLQSINDLNKTFALVHNYTDPDGLFIFDVNAKHKFEAVYGDNAYVLEAENNGEKYFCAWENYYDKSRKTCDFYLTLFTENKKTGEYKRSEESQRERFFSTEEIEKALSDNGFELLIVTKDYKFSLPDRNSDRLYYVARVKK